MERSSHEQQTLPKNSAITIVLPLLFVLFYQCLWIWTYGATISLKGCLIFILEIALYLMNLFWVLPELYGKKNYLRFFVKTVAAIAVFILIKMRIIFSAFWTERFWELLLSSEQWMHTYTQCFLIIGTSCFVGFYRQSERNFIEKEVALNANMNYLNEMRRLETTSYQLQLNPHFTFNVLNTIRLQTQHQLPGISRAIHLLASILRQSLLDPINPRKVNLSSEIQMLEDFIELQQFLRNDILYLNYRKEFPPVFQQLEVPPGIFITIADNLFKYGVTNEAEYTAQFTIDVTGNRLKLRTWNYKSLYILSGLGLGLKNILSILEYYYQEKFKLTVEDREDTYELNLEIEL